MTETNLEGTAFDRSQIYLVCPRATHAKSESEPMRPLEWLFYLAFMPTLLLPWLPARLRRWPWLTATLPVLLSVPHLLSEGWRAQMLPLYLLALLLLISRLSTWLGRLATGQRGRVVSGLLALALVLGGLLPGWLLPTLTLPTPTGPYAVGIIDRELGDPARGRRLMVSIWYPAAQPGAAAPLTQHPAALTSALHNLTGLPALVFQHLRYAKLSASVGAPMIADTDPLPVLLFSHGLVGLRLQNSSTLQELASWGYVIVAIDHTDAAAVTVFPDGETRFYNLARFGLPTDREANKAQVTAHGLPVWIADQRFVYDQIESWQQHDPIFAGKLDLARMGAFGHSFGGATALEVCRVDARCRAVANLDGGLYGESVTKPAIRPLLLMTSAESSQLPVPMAEWTQLIKQTRTPAYWVELPQSNHLSFTFIQLLSPLLIPQGFEPRAGLRVVDEYLRAFFDHHLRDIESPLLTADADATKVHWLAP